MKQNSRRREGLQVDIEFVFSNTTSANSASHSLRCASFLTHGWKEWNSLSLVQVDIVRDGTYKPCTEKERKNVFMRDKHMVVRSKLWDKTVSK